MIHSGERNTRLNAVVPVDNNEPVFLIGISTYAFADAGSAQVPPEKGDA
jgi:hypothetical protein